MNMPGFTAEASVYAPANFSTPISVGVPKSEVVHHNWFSHPGLLVRGYSFVMHSPCRMESEMCSRC
jgi:hypothetical protein